MVNLPPDGPVWALGLMSGTSLDGVDAALLRTDGTDIAAFGPGAEVPHQPEDTAALRRIMADWPAHRPATGDAARATLAAADDDVIRTHARAVTDLLSRHKGHLPDLIGFHGQTVAHAPQDGWTWQIGDGARLAAVLNRPVVWDFRSNDMVAGGEGAPLAPFYHWALARHIGARKPVAFLNIGGVANVTWVDPQAEVPEAPGALLAFDTGPGNALLNDWMLRRTGAAMDRDGAAAAAGQGAGATLHSGNAALAFLARRPPKSLDRNSFAAVLDRMDGMTTAAGAAALTALSVDCIAAAVPHLPSPPSRWLVCGGGRRNAEMMRLLAAALAAPVAAVEAVGLNGDLLEAQAFAWLAVRAARGLPLSAPGTTGCREPVTGGRVSCP